MKQIKNLEIMITKGNLKDIPKAQELLENCSILVERLDGFEGELPYHLTAEIEDEVVKLYSSEQSIIGIQTPHEGNNWIYSSSSRHGTSFRYNKSGKLKGYVHINYDPKKIRRR